MLTLTPAPVNDHIEYETKVFWNGIDEQSPYQGEPTDEMDELWSDLYGGMVAPCPSFANINVES